MRWIIRISGVLVLLLIASVLVVPTHEYTDRARVTEFILLASAARAEVVEFIQSHPSGTPVLLTDYKHPIDVGRYGKMESSAGNPVFLEHFEVSQNGAIIIMTSGLSVYIELTPIVEGQQVKKWHCYGRPHKLMPTMCKNEKPIIERLTGFASGSRG